MIVEGVATLIFAGGLALGAGFAWERSAISPGKGQIIRNGAWWTSCAFGSSLQSLRLRAYVARTGILALSQSEVIYFQTDLDDERRPLSCKHVYEVSGKTLDAAWWSLTVYDETYHYFPIEGARASYNSRNLPIDSDGNWQVRISTIRQREPWIPVRGDGALRLTIRLYRPSEGVRRSLDTLSLPRIQMIGAS